MSGYDEVGTDPRRRAMIQDLKHVVTAIHAQTVAETGVPEWRKGKTYELKAYPWAVWAVLDRSRYMIWENILRTGQLWRVEVYVVFVDRTVNRVSEWSSDDMWEKIQEEQRYEDIGGQAS